MLRPSRLPYFGCTEVHPMHGPLCGPTNLYTLDTSLGLVYFGLELSFIIGN